MSGYRRDDDGNGDAPCLIGEGKIIRETDKAVLARIGEKEFWIPKSCVHDDSEAFSMKNSDGKVIVKQWWAEKNGHA